MGKVISVINLKGGVGKTTTTVQLAECLSSQFGKKVLVIDLDPQTNSTISLIDEELWEKLDEQGK
ncbi:MAG: AAA family ATPase, partial [Pseudomonadales bacterium]|nr:AAA family ATPase [Pseudomonadales bacterium]